jgi:hypothetical protein
MQIYMLTAVTRNAAANRRVVIKGFDIPARGLMIAAVAFIPALIVALVTAAIFGFVGFLMIPVVELATFWLIEGRTRNGLQQRNYRTFLDKKKSIAGKFICCGQEFDPLHGTWGSVVASSVTTYSTADLFDLGDTW